jgi:hypothetical protein
VPPVLAGIPAMRWRREIFLACPCPRDDAIGPRDFLKNHICSLMAFHPKVLNPALIFFQVILFIFSNSLN